MRLLITTLVFTLAANAAHAGLMEISYTYSTRDSFIDDDNYQKSFSHTGSFAWYFIEMSAIELSYTKGEGEVSGKSSTDSTAIKYLTQFEMYDASLIITLGGKQSFFQPYVKGGAAWVDKRIYRTDALVVNEEISKTDKTDAVPSWGVGFRLFFTKNLSLKASYDRWRTGKSGSDEIWDEAIRGGLSLMF